MVSSRRTASPKPPSRTNNENADTTCDHYNRMPEYVKLMKSLGVNAYRFSIAWSRIIPLGGHNDPVNEKGVRFYNNLIDNLLAHGFLGTEEFRANFARYSRLCFSLFGDRVKKWITFNEPYIISINAHCNGTLAPGRYAETGADTKTEPWRVSHTIILAHADIVQMYFRDPVSLGKDYPLAMRAYLGQRLPDFTSAERDLLRRTAPMYAFYGEPAEDGWTGNIEESSINSQGQEIGPVSGVYWLRTAPEGFRKLMSWVCNRYRLPLIITENGCPCPEGSDVKVAVHDAYRQRYFGSYLDAISRAIYEDGIPVEGYYAWRLMDNFGLSTPLLAHPSRFYLHLTFANRILRMVGWVWSQIWDCSW
ncbi:glycoside hydrolase superfamily [Fusarium avenaceum]|nr:glycoside hydrolase superfamily [Fusarium avenaceum]